MDRGAGYRDAAPRPSVGFEKPWYAIYGGQHGFVRTLIGLWLVPAALGFLAFTRAAPAIFFAVLVFAFGAVALYSGVAILLNRTRVKWDGQTLAVSHGPLPWPGSQIVFSGSTCVVSAVAAKPSGLDPRGGSEGSPTHDIVAQTGDTRVVLFRMWTGPVAANAAASEGTRALGALGR